MSFGAAMARKEGVVGGMVVALCQFATGSIYKHELIDGEVHEISCESLDDCYLKGVSTPGMLLHRSWATEINWAMERRASRIAGLNASALFSRQVQVRELFRRLFKAEFPRGIPNARQIRRYEDEERGVSVTKLLFESWPGHSVPAVLFTPLGAESGTQKLPGVLHIPGHLAPGLRDPAEQRLSLGLAQRGYAVLTFDPISQGERQVYPEEFGLECHINRGEAGDVCKSAGPPCSTAHDHLGKQLWLMGHSAAELFLQDAQRALDFLAGLPWVDASLIGAIGCSGGGMLTAYLAAVDERVRAAAIACYFSTLSQELEKGTCNYDAEQIIWGQARLGLDKPDLLAARAPRPTVVLLTSHDCFPISGGQEGWHEATPFFAAHGPNELGEYGIGVSETAGFHGVTDMGLDIVYSIFGDYLEPPPLVPPPKDTSPLPCERLWFGEALAIGAD
eukprot:CAMPEP_0204162094 /NCGR_PEP_ID=MMETSP0361-20130328/35273_1 /ASSEMBLY_ACC=CAM_ASM_000343 /TAXON_ID=268821 /ORGANISM="Scrippsiella Hangoei, Strain SHTV-5" /LENGTH=447 /DNA_ID=CAMNT_0051118631 /DNA_START=124 /DNA_END=1465 /DNA_ORIENTATION=-